MKKILLTIVAFVAVIGVAAFLYRTLSPNVDSPNLLEPPASTNVSSSDEQQVPVNKEKEADILPAMDFMFYNADGEAVQLSDFYGKPIVLNFWASWCGPCKMEMPYFQKAYDTYQDDVVFIMLNLTSGQETKEAADRFIAAEGFNFPIYYDTEQMGAMTYGVRYIPTTLFIDAEGNIAAVAQTSLSEEMLQEGMDMIL